jgi:hypothetical protein
VPIPNRIKSKSKYKLSEHHNNQKNPPIQETLNHLYDKKKIQHFEGEHLQNLKAHASGEGMV